jgi:hypothetical protein
MTHINPTVFNGRYSNTDITDRVRINIEGTDNKNIDGTGLMSQNILSINTDCVKMCIDNILSVLQQPWRVQPVTMKTFIMY